MDDDDQPPSGEMDYAAVLAHNEKFAGGSVIITYRGETGIVPRDDVVEAVDELEGYGGVLRRHVIASVNAALASNFSAVRDGTAPQEIGIAFAQDLALWFANEVIEGRAVLAADTAKHPHGG